MTTYVKVMSNGEEVAYWVDPTHLPRVGECVTFYPSKYVYEVKLITHSYFICNHLQRLGQVDQIDVTIIVKQLGKTL
jgi:phenylalanine-4-hydroxylase